MKQALVFTEVNTFEADATDLIKGTLQFFNAFKTIVQPDFHMLKGCFLVT